MESCWNCGVLSASRYCPQCGQSKSGPAPEQADVAVYENRSVQVRPTAPVLRRAPEQTISLGQVQGIVHDTAAGTLTEKAAYTYMTTEEGMAWTERPSPLLLAPLGLKYLLALFFAAVVFRSAGLTLVLLLAALLHGGVKFLNIRSSSYRLTNERLEITSGLLNQTVVAYEVFQIGEAVISRPLLLRIFGLSNVGFQSGIVLSGIRYADRVRDIIRMFGQAEASRIDRIPWRQ